MNTKKFFSSVFTLSGTIIGAGILGLPYVFSSAGYLVGLFWLIVLGSLVLLSFLYICEVSLRTKGRHQLPGLAYRYLGNKGKYFMLFAMIFGIYTSLVAYLIGEGRSISIILFNGPEYSLFCSVLFWSVLTILVQGDLRRLRKVESYGVIFIVLIIFGLFFFFLPSVDISNISYTNAGYFFAPLGVTLFALLGFTSLPEVREEMRGSEKHLKKVIFLGTLLPILLYALFSFSFVGVLGEGVEEIATLSFGPFLVVLGAFTMFTSYFVLDFALKDIFIYDMGYSKKKTSFYTSLVPLVLFLFAFFLDFDGFIFIIGIGGVVSGGATAVAGIFMNYKAKMRKPERKPEFSMYINKYIVLALTILFCLVVFLEVFNSFKVFFW